MSIPDPCIVEKNLIVKLQPLICGSDGGFDASNNQFCASRPSAWPVTNAHQTVLNYPETENTSSIPGTADFCFAYMDWYVESGCNNLTWEIQNIVNREPQCKILSPVEKDLLVNNLVSSGALYSAARYVDPMTAAARSSTASAAQQENQLPSADSTCLQAINHHPRVRELIQERCQGMDGKELQKLATFCQDVQSNERKYPKPSGDDSTGWGKWFGGGGILAALLYAIRFAKKFYDLGKELKEAGKSVGYFARALTVVNQEARLLMDAMVGALDNVKYFFASVGAKTVEVIKYIFKGEWLPGRKKAIKEKEKSAQKNEGQSDDDAKKKRLRRTNPFLRPVGPGVDSIVGKPERDVVLSQIQTLTSDPRHSALGEIFARLEERVQIYLAELAINRWNLLSAEEQENYSKADTSPYYGKLPFAYIKWFAEKYIRPSMVISLRAAASEWAKEMARKLAAEVEPVLENVERQFLVDRQLGRTFVIAQYTARLAIEEWNSYDVEKQSDFITDVIKPPDRGELPIQFIRTFKKSINLEQTSHLAPIYTQLLEYKPTLVKYPFSIINARVKVLYLAWKGLADSIQKEFGIRDDIGRLPQTFIELMRSSLAIGITRRDKMKPDESPWKFDPQAKEKLYEHINLSLVMKILVQENPELASYSRVLELRSKALVDDWRTLPDNIKQAFKQHDVRNGTYSISLEIPITYIKLWQRLNSGIGITDRTPIEPQNGPDGSGAAGGTPGSGGITGFMPSGSLASGPSAPHSAPMAMAPAGTASSFVTQAQFNGLLTMATPQPMGAPFPPAMPLMSGLNIFIGRPAMAPGL